VIYKTMTTTDSRSQSAAESCRVVLLTPEGRGAVATILVEGTHATDCVSRHFRPAAGKPIEQFPIGRIVFGHWTGGSRADEELVVCRRDPQRVEVHCHGGHAAADSIIESLVSAGCQQLDWQSWAKTSEADPLSAAALIALSAARTERTAAVLLDQYRGAMRAALIETLALLETGNGPAAIERLNDLLRWANVGLHLVEPFRVVVAGPANVGKSSLINAILGYQRSIIFDQPGTTRDVVTAHTAIDGWPVELADTAGLRASEDELESAGVARALDRISAADLVVLVFDASQPWTENETARLDVTPHAVVVQNKWDLVEKSVGERPAGLLTSAVTGAGVAELVARLAQRLVPETPPPGTAVPFNTSQIHGIEQSLNAARRGDWQSAAAALATMLNYTACGPD
jgi:tRNA modification GTPase